MRMNLLFLGVALLFFQEGAVADYSDYNAVFSYNLSSSVTPCRSWIVNCGEGSYRCTDQNSYATSLLFPLGCPTIPGSDPTPPPGTTCSLANNSCSFVADAPTCVSWLGSCACDYLYSCATEDEFDAAIEEDGSCSFAQQPPSPDSLCVSVNSSCEWYNPCRTWLGWCGGSYRCGTEADYASFLNGPQPLCLPPVNYTEPDLEGECVYQDGQCVWSDCVSWLSPCRTRWECGSQYDYQVSQALPPPPCPAPPLQFMSPPEPAVCQISDNGTCEYQGQPECTGGQEYTMCGTLCPRTCDNYQLDYACTSQCVPGCFCPESTVLHNGECISSSYCPGEDPCSTIFCGPGYECLTYEETGEGYCSPNCEELNPCRSDQECVLTIVNCIRSPCPPQLSCEDRCTGGKEWQECGTACPLSCTNYSSNAPCTEQCVRGCFCPADTYIHQEQCVSIADCRDYAVCDGCREVEVCSAVVESNGAKYSICKGPITVPCTGGDDSCDPGYRCVTHNVTGNDFCVRSCYLQNGGCSEDQVCYYQRKDDDEEEEEECNQLLEPCFQTTCTSLPDKVSEESCLIGWEYTECGSACPSTCEDYLNPRIRACIAVCAHCQCPAGLVVFRDRCVDPLQCFILLNESTPLNPLPQPRDVFLIKFTLAAGVSRDMFDSAMFATSVRNLLLRNGLNLPVVDAHAVLEENSSMVVIIKIKTGDPDLVESVANLLINNRNSLSNDVSSASIVSIPSGGTEDEDEDEDEGGVSLATIVGVVVGATVVLSLTVLVIVVIATVFLLRHRKMTKVPVQYDEKEKTLDTLSFARLVSQQDTAENDYETS